MSTADKEPPDDEPTAASEPISDDDPTSTTTEPAPDDEPTAASDPLDLSSLDAPSEPPPPAAAKPTVPSPIATPIPAPRPRAPNPTATPIPVPKLGAKPNVAVKPVAATPATVRAASPAAPARATTPAPIRAATASPAQPERASVRASTPSPAGDPPPKPGRANTPAPVRASTPSPAGELPASQTRRAATPPPVRASTPNPAGDAPPSQPRRAATPPPVRASTPNPAGDAPPSEPRRAATPPPVRASTPNPAGDAPPSEPRRAATPPPVRATTPSPDPQVAGQPRRASSAPAASEPPPPATEPPARPSEPRLPRAASEPAASARPSEPRLPRAASEPAASVRPSEPHLPLAASEPAASARASQRFPSQPRPASQPSGPIAPASDAHERASSTVQPAPWLRIARALPWAVVSLPALYQIVLLVTAIAGRLLYPYDLEWMEGGMLHHALRIHNGEGIYVPPSIDFIPYLYTPLYPSLLALFGGAFGITYTLGRVLSVLALVGIVIVTAFQIGSKRHDHVARGPVCAGIALAFGLFAAVYPYLEGWFDLVRADTLFLFMVTAGIAGLPRWARTGSGLRGHAKVAAGAALLALAFFCKQTGIVYVALGGMIVLVLAWRRVPIFVATAGAIGLGGTWLLQRTTDGWFWTYASEIHRAHDFNMDRFWKSFGNILLHFPIMTVVIGIGLVTVTLTWIGRRELPKQAHALLLWSAAFAVSTVIGAIGWGTEFAHFNAYMPAFLHGALAAGAAVPAVYACWRLEFATRRHPHAIATGASLALAAGLGLVCWNARWEPRKFTPTERDVAAGDALVARLRSIEGHVWMPSHPWYLHLAGKTPRVHRMGVKDVTTRQPRVVLGLDDALRRHAFAALVLDDRDLHVELPLLHRQYRAAMKLPPGERPRVYTGARVTPDSIWVPAIRAVPPAGARVLYDFEHPTWAGEWTRSGAAWGNGPVATALPGQGLVLGASGTRFATSMHDGDASSGRISSPMFPLDGARISLQIGGGTDATKLRVELWTGDAIIATASAPLPGGGRLREVVLEIPEAHRGSQGKLVLVDDSPVGHLSVDDVWLWQPK